MTYLASREKSLCYYMIHSCSHENDEKCSILNNISY